MAGGIATKRHGGFSSLREKILIALLLFFTIIGVGSWPWFAMAICLLIGGYAHLSRRELGWAWVALPVAFAIFFLAAGVIQAFSIYPSGV